MSRPIGRHRARRETGLRALRRPAVAATAAISAVSVSAAGYATASSAVASGPTGATFQTGTEASGAALGAANAAVVADATAQLTAKNAAVAARTAAQGKTKSALAKQRAQSAAFRTKAEKAAAAKRSSVAKAKARAAAKAKAAAKARAEAQRARTNPTTSRSETRPPARTYGGSPQAIASSMLASYGWGQDQMGCLTALWNKESGWNVYATNPSSGAYGIPQSLPGSKMASAGADWRTNPATQIRWGLGYIRASYGSPCGAWGHSQATGWY